MSTAMNTNNHHHQHSTLGFLLIIADLINNEQRDEMLQFLKQALKQIVSNNPLHNVNDRFNRLINDNEFHFDSQYRQMENTEDGSIVGFLYLPNFHTVFNVLQDYFNTCSNITVIFCGQQIASNGALILADSVFTSEHLSSLLQSHESYQLENLHLILPFISTQWKKLFEDQLSKSLQRAQINNGSAQVNDDNEFGEVFYEKISGILQDKKVNFDIDTKLIPKDSSGTIAFDEPNLYVLYGQQGEASLFGVRGFVVLVNGGFSRIPSYWNLIRGLQSIDACILTHFDYDVLPGLQSVIHRKTIPSLVDGQLCKPDIGVLFLNQIQRAKLQSSSSISSNSQLLVNLNDNINQFLQDTKQLKIHTMDLVKSSSTNKTLVEPINLYKKIAFGSLDLYVLHPLGSTIDDEKTVTNLQKILIHDQLPSSEIIPVHHWYSSCSLLVWTPALKSDKDKIVRILYTGACPQTLVFEALTRVRQSDFLHVSSSLHKSQPTRVNHVQTAPTVHSSAPVKRSSSQSKTNGKTSSSMIKKTPVTKVTPPKPIKSDKIVSKPTTKKMAPILSSTGPIRSASKDKKPMKSSVSSKKPSPQISKPKPTNEQKKTSLENHDKQEPKLSSTGIHEQNLDHQIETVPEEEEEILSHPAVPTEYQLESTAKEEDEEEEIQPQPEAVTEETDVTHEEPSEAPNQDSDSEPIYNDNEEPMNEDYVNAKDEEEEVKDSDQILSSNHTDDVPVDRSSDSPIEDIDTQTEPTITTVTERSLDDSELATGVSKDEEEEEEVDDDMEIIHHHIPEGQKMSSGTTEEIHPQGLPIESKNSSAKKLTDSSHRVSRPSTLTTNGNQRTASQSKQMPSTDFIFHVDVAYIPYHGHEHYVDKDFFRRIRAEYYILNAVETSRRTLESLIEGKQEWESNEQITLVPTFDSESLRQFFLTNKSRLAELNINILPASSRCHVQYDDEGSPAQRLRFHTITNTDEE